MPAEPSDRNNEAIAIAKAEFGQDPIGLGGIGERVKESTDCTWYHRDGAFFYMKGLHDILFGGFRDSGNHISLPNGASHLHSPEKLAAPMAKIRFA